MADQVGRDHRVAVGQRQRDLLPVSRGVDHAVDQDHRRTVARHAVDHPVAVQLDVPGGEVLTAPAIQLAGNAPAGHLARVVGEPAPRHLLGRPALDHRADVADHHQHAHRGADLQVGGGWLLAADHPVGDQRVHVVELGRQSRQVALQPLAA